jgi:hypothetical protein
MSIVVYNKAQLETIEKARAEHNWFTAIVLSAVQLEHNGCLKIKEYLLSLHAEPKIVDSVLEKFDFRDTIRCLKAMGIIDTKEEKKMQEINTERNHFVHRSTKEKFKRGKEADLKYDPLVVEAVRILKEKLDVMRIAVFPTEWTIKQ